jgi:hypothetical protein
MRAASRDEYLVLAEKYERLAQEAHPALRQQFENLAKEWRRLAAKLKTPDRS